MSKKFNKEEVLEKNEETSKGPTILLYSNIFGVVFITISILFVIILYIVLQWVVTDVRRDLFLSEKKGIILQFDELLTMSARLAAAKNDTKFVDRYNDNVNTLDKAIADVISTIPVQIRQKFQNLTFEANNALVAMETQANNFVLGGLSNQSLAILFSAEYEFYKKQYSLGLEVLFTFITEQANLNQILKIIFTSVISGFFLFFVPVAIVVTIFSFCFFQRTIQRHFETKYEKIISDIKMDKFKSFLIKDLFTDNEKLSRFVKRVGSSEKLHFSKIFTSDRVKEAFKSFCEKEWSFENLLIFEEILYFKELKDDNMKKEKAVEIYNQYLTPDSPIQVNISFDSKKKMEERLKMLDFSFIDMNGFFNEVESDVKNNLKDVMLRFQFSDDYNHVKENNA